MPGAQTNLALILLLFFLSACDADGPSDAAPEPPDLAVPGPLPSDAIEELLAQEGGEEADAPECLTIRLPLILGHRGIAWNHTGNPYPENTVLSVGAALDAGADGVEIDLLKSVDDVVVLAHENNLAFTSSKGLPKTDCTGKITSTPWEDLQDCHALSYMEDGLSSPLDRVEQLLEVRDDATLVLDVKNDQKDHDEWVTVLQIMNAVEAAQLNDAVILMLYRQDTIRFASLWDVRACLKVHTMADRTPAQLADEVAQTGAWGLCANSKILSADLLAAHHDRDLEVVTYYLGENSKDSTYDKHIADWIAWGVYGIITDRVARGAALMDQVACP